MSTQTLPQYLGYNIPAVCIQFDDSLASHYTEAYAYMNPLGMKGNCYVYTGGGGIGDENLTTMYDAGWDICNHTDDGTVLTSLTEAQQETTIGNCTTYLEGLGFSRSSHHVTYPSGAYNANTLTAMSNLSMLTGKTKGENLESMRYISANPHLILVYAPQATTTPASVIGWLQACQCSKSVATIVFHNIAASGATGNQYNRADFREIIDWIYAQQMIVLTTSQVYSLMSGSIEYTNYWE